MRTFVAAVAALLSLGAVAPAHAADPMAGAPTVGECHNYSYQQSMSTSEGSAAVSCAATHTAVVVAVPMLPSTMTYATDPAKVFAAVGKACYTGLNQAVGSTAKNRALSAFSLTWFYPTQAQQDAGARWVRCDVVLSRGTALAALPHTTPLFSTMTDKVRRCLVGTSHSTTACSAKHQWRSKGAVRVKSTTYPTNRVFMRVANNRCAAIVGSSTWYATWASKPRWKAGDHYVVCYRRTSA